MVGWPVCGFPQPIPTDGSIVFLGKTDGANVAGAEKLKYQNCEAHWFLIRNGDLLTTAQVLVPKSVPQDAAPCSATINTPKTVKLPSAPN